MPLMVTKDKPTASSLKPAQTRAVRSFVRRAGRMTVGQQRAMGALWPLYGIEAGSGQLDLEQHFGQAAPVNIEIGFGNGENLVAAACRSPEQNFLGIEVHEPGIGHCLLRIEEFGLSNVRLLREDAVHILRDCIATASISRTNLYFPDPWPKKRHHKRRLVQPSFVSDIARILLPGGIFHVATDWPAYAEHIEVTVSASLLFDAIAKPPTDRIATRFDKRGERLGHRNWEGAWCTHSKLHLGN